MPFGTIEGVKLPRICNSTQRTRANLSTKSQVASTRNQGRDNASLTLLMAGWLRFFTWCDKNANPGNHSTRAALPQSVASCRPLRDLHGHRPPQPSAYPQGGAVLGGAKPNKRVDHDAEAAARPHCRRRRRVDRDLCHRRVLAIATIACRRLARNWGNPVTQKSWLCLIVNRRS